MHRLLGKQGILLALLIALLGQLQYTRACNGEQIEFTISVLLS